jgi:hypothetical protein
VGGVIENVIHGKSSDCKACRRGNEYTNSACMGRSHTFNTCLLVPFSSPAASIYPDPMVAKK